MKLLDYLKSKGYKPKGIGNVYRISCPFPDHKETKPSFTIWPENNTFHCFGCQRTGGIVKLMKLFGDPIPVGMVEEEKRIQRENSPIYNPILLDRINRARTLIVRIRNVRPTYKNQAILNKRVAKLFAVFEGVRL